MPDEHALVSALQPHDRPLSADDTMAEAGRTVLLRDFIDMLNHESGALTGEDTEDLHEMRVATRRMRSALRLLEPYYTGKTAAKFRKQLGDIADVLGDIRDRDVLLDDMNDYLPALPEDVQAELRRVMQWLEGERESEREDLHDLVSKRNYGRFIAAFQKFLTTPEAHAVALTSGGKVTPMLVRHVLPTVIYEHLGIVRAYGALIEDADGPTLHQLRIEFKRLRYTVTLFEELLGASTKSFIKELKAVQDLLGRMQDIVTAHALLDPMQARLDDAQLEALNAYFVKIDEESEELRGQVMAVWRHFDTKTVQKQLTSAVALL
ncbi:MAG TPA: CHAD domain-containing protein [Candidatus Limnocylindrales bacterium]|nr:CHAD domain-containing protein [Candidatus Limnocylindrales bacterium]